MLRSLNKDSILQSLTAAKHMHSVLPMVYGIILEHRDKSQTNMQILTFIGHNVHASTSSHETVYNHTT